MSGKPKIICGYFKYIFAKVTEAAADANYELSERLDLIVSQGIEENE